MDDRWWENLGVYNNVKIYICTYVIHVYIIMCIICIFMCTYILYMYNIYVINIKSWRFFQLLMKNALILKDYFSKSSYPINFPSLFSREAN